MAIVSVIGFETMWHCFCSLTLLLLCCEGLVPTKFSESPALGRWVSTQRSQYKMWKNGDKTTMTEVKFKKLANLGFVWCMLP